MKCLKIITVVLVFSCTVCADDTSELEYQENTREVKEYNQEGWKALETFSDDLSSWIPQDQSQEYRPKRRRLRKRKRRPQVINTSDGTIETSKERYPPNRRRIRPQRLDEISQPWEELNDAPLRPYVRRRLTPVYQSQEDIVALTGEVSGSLGAAISFGTENDFKKDSNKETQADEKYEETTKTSELKSILKQNGGLSLSEILEQKNLTLSELLTGNRKVISALTERPVQLTSSTTNPKIFVNTVIGTIKEPRIRFRPSIGLKNNAVNKSSEKETTEQYEKIPSSTSLHKNLINRKFEQDIDSFESLSNKEMLEAQRKRLSVLNAHRDTDVYSKLNKVQVITEPTTEKRIFVHSQYKYYTSLDSKPSFNTIPEQTTEPYIIYNKTEEPTSLTNTIEQNKLYTRIYLKPKAKDNLPITNAKLNSARGKTNNDFLRKKSAEQNYPTETILPPKAIKISIEDIFGYAEKKKLKTTENKDEPFRLSIDISQFTEKTTVRHEKTPALITMKSTPSLSTTTTVAHTSTMEAETTTQEVLIDKIKPFTAKDEIMEVLKDPLSKEKLSRILRSRNMTIKELVEQRERGSSQLHLADIFHNKTREPEPKDEPFVGEINPEYFNNNSIFRRQQKSLIAKEYSAKPTAQQIVSNGSNDILTVTSFPTFKIELNRGMHDYRGKFFPWRELYPDFFNDTHENNNEFNTKSQYPAGNLEVDIQRLDDTESKFSSASNEKLNTGENDFEDEVLGNLPSGVKSAILASSAIIGLSLVVFVTILVIFRWTQKQRLKFNYCNSLSSKIRSPFLEGGPRSFKTFVSETLGRKKLYYKSNMQSMSDSIWEKDRKSSF